MRFTLRQLSYFVAAGETGSVTRAAELVNISQPSVSAAISHLETELGVQIFVRQHAQGLSLTTPGKRLLRAAKESLRAAYELYDVANAAGSIVSGPINVGSFRTFSSLIMPELWSGFVSKYPDAQMVVTEGSEAELLEGLRSARIDIALTYQLNLTPDMSFQPLAEMPSYVLLAADHRFATRASVRLEELADEPFILLDLPLSRQYFLSMFEQRSITPRIVAETASPSTLRSYVGAGLGFSMLTVRPVNMMAENGRPLAYIELEGNTAPMVMGLACLKDMRRPRIVDAFEAHCREVITVDHIPGMRGTDSGPSHVIAD